MEKVLTLGVCLNIKLWDETTPRLGQNRSFGQQRPLFCSLVNCKHGAWYAVGT